MTRRHDGGNQVADSRKLPQGDAADVNSPLCGEEGRRRGIVGARE
jgi:hypothetical protein